MKSKENIIYNYCGCLYPYGVTNKENLLYFNKIDINEIVKIMIIDEETSKVLDYVEQKSKALKIK